MPEGSAPDRSQARPSMVAGDNPRGREFWKRCGWEEIAGALRWELIFRMDYEPRRGRGEAE